MSSSSSSLPMRWCALLGVSAALTASPESQAQRFADTLGYYEPGLNVDSVFNSNPVELFDNPLAALGGPGETVTLSEGNPTQIVSLGTYTDDPATGTNTRPTGLVIGFSDPAYNVPGDDLLVVGNAPSSFTFYEPGFIEVARETSGLGATATGWMDETFYLIKPSNFSQITDPRLGSNAITVTSDPFTFELNYSSPFDDPDTLKNYFDVTPGGDGIDLDDAIDASGNPVSLFDISYIRLRAVSDSAFPFTPVSYLAPEVDYVEALSIPGDFDLDSDVDGNDFGIFAANFGTLSGATFLTGDLTGDGAVNGNDFGIFSQYFGTGVPSAAPGSVVPEPGSLALLTAAGMAALMRRRTGQC